MAYVNDDCLLKDRIVENPSIASLVRRVISCATRCVCIRYDVKILINASPITRMLLNVVEDCFVDPICFVHWIVRIVATIYETPAVAYIKI